MSVTESVGQSPEPGRRLIAFRGDDFTFRLELSIPMAGTGWLRTNIGHAHRARRETIRQVDANEKPLHMDWFDIPMISSDPVRFELTLPLCEVGHFQAKAYFLPDSDGQPVWPAGENTTINVEPAETVCGNIIYNAFIRQFGPNKKTRRDPPAQFDFDNLDAEGYTVIPPSGTFRSFIRELDFIVHELGCRYIQLLPIYPTPTTYGRMGRFGSPYAAQSFKLVDTALAEFDSRATPLQQFMELVDAIHRRHAKLILDIAINHTGWGARIHETHPHWVKRGVDGRIEVPGAWGVWWEDLTKLDFSHQDLWQFMATVFLTWCRRGVDGFRCDAGYMIPVDAWRYIVARVREEYPDTLFFLEGLGGLISATRDILNVGNFNWAYSELFQNYDRGQIEHYLPDADAISCQDGLIIHFAETHDNNRLAAVSTTYARMRTALCAMLSHCGGFAFANGVEWYATEKIIVHDANPLNWGAEVNQVDHIRRLNTILKVHPAFFDRAELAFVQEGGGNFLAVHRRHAPTEKEVLIVANLDHERGVLARWRPVVEPMANGVFIDLIASDRVGIGREGDAHTLGLEPGQVRCLSPVETDLADIRRAESEGIDVPPRIGRQRLRAKALDVFRYFHGIGHLGDFDPDDAAARLGDDPEGFCRRYNRESTESRVIAWHWPGDLKREVMVPPAHFLLIRAPVHFEARLTRENHVSAIEHALADNRGGYFILFPPISVEEGHQAFELDLTLYEAAGTTHTRAPLLYLGHPESLRVDLHLDRNALTAEGYTLLGTNGAGALMRASSRWGYLHSRYDALLAANLNTEMPVDRWIMFTRCRGWLVYQDYSQEIRTDCIEQLSYDYSGTVRWQYRIPTGLGQHIFFSVGMEIVPRQNRVRLHFHRHPSVSPDQLPDDRPVRLILRPDIESRSFHETTKAYTGPEQKFPAFVTPREWGFGFSPDPHHQLHIDMVDAVFEWEPEWAYMVRRPLEAERGMDPDSDLFSPGWFRGDLAGGETLVLDARVLGNDDGKPATPLPEPFTFTWKNEVPSIRVADAMALAMDQYVVDRQRLKSVIAGFPWFLDWGRDSLIFCRGLIAAGKFEAAGAVIKLFGCFEANGTLPNMICGQDARNRDTSDASLWFMIVCRDYVAAAGSLDFLDEPCGGRTIREILFSIAAGYAAGTPNGVKMDADTGLIFSPSHFTWMDTNFPAGSPREGYPIEIQSLWHAALEFLSTIAPPDGFQKTLNLEKLAKKVAASVTRFFYRADLGYLSDCLHCHPGTAPKDAIADDALRPNQLFAITMGAVVDNAVCRDILAACSELVVPGAIRSLADRPVRYPLEIRRNGELLGDPFLPYRGRYLGDEDHSRKPAYHNGTAWTWVFPSYCEAWAAVYGEAGKRTALAWLGSSSILINRNCLGHLPEILDGDRPHYQRGCDAQAWSASELYRVWKKLTEEKRVD